MSKQHRNHYRLEYPVPDRPTIRANGTQFEVIEASEAGLKFNCNGTFVPILGTPFKGTVFFRDGKTFELQGKILRFDKANDHCVVHLTKGIPLAKMIEEQLLLIRKYKGDT